MSNVTKAIIPVAGWGTRMLPITKSIEKCMLPIGNRPVIDYIVQDVIRAGVRDIYFVVGEQSTQVQSYYGRNHELEAYLQRQGKEDKLPLVGPIEGVNFHYIVQPSDGKYGTAVPVGLVNEYIADDELVAVIMGDDFLYSPDGTNDIARLIEAAGETGSMIGVTVPREDVSKYGVLELDEARNYKRIVEKPDIDEAPSNLINVSKYVLPKEAIEAAVTIAPNPARGEYELPDVINQYVSQGGVMKVIEAKGEFLDTGSVESWLRANNIVISSTW